MKSCMFLKCTTSNGVFTVIEYDQEFNVLPNYVKKRSKTYMSQESALRQPLVLVLET